MIKKISKKGVKFLLAGDGMSIRTGRFLGESILVGALTGLVVVAFHFMIEYGSKWIGDYLCSYVALREVPDAPFFSREYLGGMLTDVRRYVALGLPALGALIGFLLIRRFASLEHARGTDSAILAYHRRHGYVPPAVIPIKSTASVLTVASGGSAGYEGPVTLLGAACGSVMASWFGLSARARRILMCAGISAGIAALFKAPLAGAIFGFEILYSSSDVEYEGILPCFIASAISYTIFGSFFGWDAIFTMSEAPSYDNGLRLLPYLFLAVVVTFGSRFYISFFRATERAFGRLKTPLWTKVVLGGLATGAIGFFFPDIYGTSYHVIASTLDHAPGAIAVSSCLAFFFAKAIATSFTVGSGGSGGVFAPAIACGGTLGLAVGLVSAQILPADFAVNPSAFALVGMAGFLASCNRIPIAAVVMVAEISGNHALLLPAMWVCGISFWLNNGWTLYRSQVHNRESSPVHNL